MAGIDVFTEKILQEAEEKAAAVRRKAEEQAAEIRRKAEEDAQNHLVQAEEKAEREADALAARIHARIEMQDRQAVLAARQEVIRSVISEAKERLAGQEPDAYFAMLAKLAAKAAGASGGELLLSAKDRKRMPADFLEQVQKLTGEGGKTLTLSAETAEIRDGVLIRRGGIEENCALDMLFAEKKESLQDLVYKMLW